MCHCTAGEWVSRADEAAGTGSLIRSVRGAVIWAVHLNLLSVRDCGDITGKLGQNFFGKSLVEAGVFHQKDVRADKAKIVGGTRARGPSKAYADSVAAWKAAHPTRGDVTLNGDTAIVVWTAIGPDGTGPVRSCDVFVYRAGRWRALYSQHTTAGDA